MALTFSLTKTVAEIVFVGDGTTYLIRSDDIIWVFEFGEGMSE
mgnify:CR=1 FL=1